MKIDIDQIDGSVTQRCNESSVLGNICHYPAHSGTSGKCRFHQRKLLPDLVNAVMNDSHRPENRWSYYDLGFETPALR